jgi:hypothetical protein
VFEARKDQRFVRHEKFHGAQFFIRDCEKKSCSLLDSQGRNLLKRKGRTRDLPDER